MMANIWKGSSASNHAQVASRPSPLMCCESCSCQQNYQTGVIYGNNPIDVVVLDVPRGFLGCTEIASEFHFWRESTALPDLAKCAMTSHLGIRASLKLSIQTEEAELLLMELGCLDKLSELSELRDLSGLSGILVPQKPKWNDQDGEDDNEVQIGHWWVT